MNGVRLTTLLIFIFFPVSAVAFENCNSLISHGITNITRYQSSDHAIVYKWHRYCGIDYDNATDSTVAKSHGALFGVASGAGEYSYDKQRERLNKWCKSNEEFSQNRQDLFEEARTISEPALRAWNQCQELARKQVNITFSPYGEFSQNVHFTVDSTHDGELKYYGTTTKNYSCDTHMTKDDRIVTDIESHPSLRNANIQINCERERPMVSRKEGVGRIAYSHGYIAIDTSGPSFQVGFPEVVDEYFVSPPGSVVAFDSNRCPAGWTEYKAAYGRFVRGIDKGDSEVDPDGTRKPGSFQSDAFGSHDHKTTSRVFGHRRDSFPKDEDMDPGNWGGYKKVNVSKTGESETRPKNVALLYCKRSQ